MKERSEDRNFQQIQDLVETLKKIEDNINFNDLQLAFLEWMKHPFWIIEHSEEYSVTWNRSIQKKINII
jgi:hypothetical protein